MNRNQKIVLALGACSVLLMLIFPPFHVQLRVATDNAGYAFIFNPPEGHSLTATVNVRMLLAQWAGTLAVTGLLFFALK